MIHRENGGGCFYHTCGADRVPVGRLRGAHTQGLGMIAEHSANRPSVDGVIDRRSRPEFMFRTSDSATRESVSASLMAKP